MENANAHIVFFSRSNPVFESIQFHLFEQWHFCLASPDIESPDFTVANVSDVVIVDTYSLGMGFLNKLLGDSGLSQKPILVLDDYCEVPFILNILEKGIKGYLLVHSFGDELANAIHELVSGNTYVSRELAIYKGNTYF